MQPGILGKMTGKITHINIRTQARSSSAVYIYAGRPGPLGNPFAARDSKVSGVTRVATSEEAIRLFEEFMHLEMGREGAPIRAKVLEIIDLLRAGKDVELGCWCAPAPCHAEKISNFCRNLAANIVDIVV